MLMRIVSRLMPLIKSFRSGFRARADLAIENLPLRQQVATLKKDNPRPRLNIFDRAFWVALRKIWPRWKESLLIVKPETVLGWHRRGFRFHLTGCGFSAQTRAVGLAQRCSRRSREMFVGNPSGSRESRSSGWTADAPVPWERFSSVPESVRPGRRGVG
jgi:hypothetical protein